VEGEQGGSPRKDMRYEGNAHTINKHRAGLAGALYWGLSGAVRPNSGGWDRRVTQ